MDLVGIEPTTSSMPWKRAPSCATGPLCGDTKVVERNTSLIFADCTEIVNAATKNAEDTEDVGRRGLFLDPQRPVRPLWFSFGSLIPRVFHRHFLS